MESDSQQIVERLRELRRLNGWSVRALWDQLRSSGMDIGYSVVTDWFKGTVNRIRDTNQAQLRRFIAERLPQTAATESDPAVDDGTVIQNSEALQQAITNAIIDQHRDYAGLAREANMKPDSLRRLMKGQLAYWFPNTLAKIVHDLNIDHDTLALCLTERELSAIEVVMPYMQAGAIPVRPCWVVTTAQAAMIKDIRMPFHPLSGWECRTIPVADTRDLLGFEVEGDSMSPRYLPGDVVLCEKSNQTVVNGKPCVAKFITGEVVIKVFRQYGDVIVLESLNPTGQTFDNLKKEDIEWIAPVVSMWRDERF